MSELYKPGQTVPVSGIGQIVGPRGGNVGGGRVTVVQGEPFPPVPVSGQRIEIVQVTNPKR